MKTKISKSQTEVWEWKKTASKALSNIPSKDIVDYISKEVSDMKSIVLKNRNTKYPDSIKDVNFVADK